MKQTIELRYNDRFYILRYLIGLLYDLPNCDCGGILHVVLDDDNIQTSSIEWMYNQVFFNENVFIAEALEQPLALAIMIYLKKLTFWERVCLFAMLDYCDYIEPWDALLFEEYAIDIELAVKKWIDNNPMILEFEFGEGASAKNFDFKVCYK